MAVAILLVAIGGLVARLVEPETFTSLGLAYWWAVTTVTTVGYGDIVPHDTWGRLVGAALMLIGLSLIPTVTGVVVSVLTAKRAEAQREDERRYREEQAARMARIEERLADLQRR